MWHVWWTPQRQFNRSSPAILFQPFPNLSTQPQACFSFHLPHSPHLLPFPAGLPSHPFSGSLWNVSVTKSLSRGCWTAFRITACQSPIPGMGSGVHVCHTYPKLQPVQIPLNSFYCLTYPIFPMAVDSAWNTTSSTFGLPNTLPAPGFVANLHSVSTPGLSRQTARLQKPASTSAGPWARPFISLCLYVLTYKTEIMMG